MIIFADTSALVKLYVNEEGSDHVQQMMEDFGFPCVSSVSWVEFHSAIYRLIRMKACTPTQGRSIVSQFEKEWNMFGKIEIHKSLLVRAAQLISTHPLAALDAIQLASGLEFHSKSEDPVLFLTFDSQLQSAARREKLTTRI